MTTTASTFTARDPEDMLAIVPAVLGFHPEESLVMLTFGGSRNFHARIDLPPAPSDLSAVINALLTPALRHRPDLVLFIAYSTDAVRACACALATSDAFAAHGFGVLAPLRSDGTCWFRVRPGEDPADAMPHPYDLRGHALTARTVLEGRVTLASRAELARSLGSDPEAVARVEASLSASPTGWALLEPAGARDLVARHARQGTTPEPDELGRLLEALRDVHVRDASFDRVTRARAEQHCEFWRRVVVQTPAPLLAPPAAILAYCAWLAGHGALAWCAVEKAREADADYSLARLVGDLLAAAVPPHVPSSRRRARRTTKA